MALLGLKPQALILDQQKHGIILCLVMAVGAVLASFLWQGRMGFSSADEGFLWYGTQRVLLGDVPLRDFMSYDPGRYYFAAMVMALLHDDGIISLRIAGALVQFMGLFLALLLLGRSAPKRSFFFLLAATITMIFWMFPWYKQYDIFLEIALIAVLSFIIDRPNSWRNFLAGVVVGLVAVFSRYHAVIGGIANLCAIIYLAEKRKQRKQSFAAGFLIWILGIAVGYLPVFMMMVFIPGYAKALWESIRVHVCESKGAIIPLPVPWPWLAPFGQVSFGALVRWVLSGLFFLAPLVFGVSGIFWVLYQKFHKKPVPSVLVACAFLSLPFVYYIFVTPDIGRVGLGLFPFLIGVLTILKNREKHFKWLLVGGLCASTVLVMLPNHPGWSRNRLIEVDLQGDKIKVYPETAKYLSTLNSLVAEYAPNGRSFIALPNLTTSYAIFRRKSPMYGIYPSFHRSNSLQREEIERIKSTDPGFAIIYDAPCPFLRFRDTHPLVFQYIMDHFESLYDFAADPEYLILKSKK